MDSGTTTLRVMGNLYWTFCPPVPCFDDPSDETLRLLFPAMLVHTPSTTDSTQHTVLPAPLSHQDLFHCVFIQHGLHKSNTWDCQDTSQENQLECRDHNRSVYVRWFLWVLTSEMASICFAERENTNLPKCSTSQTCHLEGSLANKCTYLTTAAVLDNLCLIWEFQALYVFHTTYKIFYSALL